MYEGLRELFLSFATAMAILTAIPTLGVVLIVFIAFRFIRSYENRSDEKRHKPPPDRNDQPKGTSDIQLNPDQVKSYFKAYGVDEKTINDILIKLFMK